MSKRRFELVDGKSKKFWEISLSGTDVRTTYGRIGTTGQTTIKAEDTASAATKLFEKLVREKTNKGYVETSVSASPPAHRVTDASLDGLARLAELAAVDAVDEDGDELLGLAGLEVLATAEQRAAVRVADLGIEAADGTLTPLVLERSGSLLAAWRSEPRAAASVVWIDSEGDPRAVLSSSLDELFTLLPHGLGYLHDCLRSAERGVLLARASDCDVEAWTEAGFAPHPAPATAVRNAYASSPSFGSWLANTAPSDPAVAVRALRAALDRRLETNEVDADTVTYHLIRMLELVPNDDALLLEYLRAVSDDGYAYTDRSLSDLALHPEVSPERAKRLALANTFAVGWCVELSRTEPPPAWLSDALHGAFALAARLGATEADWLAMRAELAAVRIGSDGRPASTEHARWTTR